MIRSGRGGLLHLRSSSGALFEQLLPREGEVFSTAHLIEDGFVAVGAPRPIPVRAMLRAKLLGSLQDCRIIDHHVSSVPVGCKDKKNKP
jgi:hypothetical protein